MLQAPIPGSRQRCSSDLSSSDWQRLEPLLVVEQRGNWPLVEVANAILYVLKTGCVAGFAGRISTLGYGILVLYKIENIRHLGVG